MRFVTVTPPTLCPIPRRRAAVTLPAGVTAQRPQRKRNMSRSEEEKEGSKSRYPLKGWQPGDDGAGIPWKAAQPTEDPQGSKGEARSGAEKPLRHHPSPSPGRLCGTSGGRKVREEWLEWGWVWGRAWERVEVDWKLPLSFISPYPNQ